MDYDVFNGDADGIFSLIQLRLNEPREAELVTGVKRDINLLSRVNAKAGEKITVLDVSMDKNKQALLQALANDAEVFYADHHFAGDIPENSNLTALINEAPDVCTSLLVNGFLEGKHSDWAVAGAFGDNLKKSALSLAQTLKLNKTDLASLENLGIYVNYNGYGAAIEDLHFPPADMYHCLLQYPSPLEFISNSTDFVKLEKGYKQDMDIVQNIQPSESTEKIAVFMLPDESWARRVSGVYSNDLTNSFPDRAHAVVTEKSDGNFLLSVRAPLNNKQGAQDLCMQFPTGGGRAAAAGINNLPADQLPLFVERFIQAYT